MVAIVSVINHLFCKCGIEAIPDVDIGVTAILKQMTPRPKDIALMLQFFVKPFGDANG